jgi:hypothetical protein
VKLHSLRTGLCARRQPGDSFEQVDVRPREDVDVEERSPE